ncbi:uncharacterized protein TNCV_2381901 [Trichonephila clavipes]|nr:uncharacterized protein TNCV_2381901 [Trichonephila clavipes]
MSPKRHFCRVSATDKRCRVYPFDPHPDAVALYSECTPGKRSPGTWFLPDDRHTASLVGLRGGWRHARTKLCTRTDGSNAAVPSFQSYAQATKSSSTNNYTQTDENITKIKCPPLQLLPPLSSVPQPNAYLSIPSVSTSSSYANILPSASLSSIKPTIQIESQLPDPIYSAAAPDNSLNTSASSLSAETCPVPTISNKFAALQPSVPLSDLQLLHPIANFLLHLKSHRMLKRIQKMEENAQKPEIEIKMAKHKPKKSGPTEYTTDDECLIMYDVEEEELELDPTDKFAITEHPTNFSK